MEGRGAVDRQEVRFRYRGSIREQGIGQKREAKGGGQFRRDVGYNLQYKGTTGE